MRGEEAVGWSDRKEDREEKGNCDVEGRTLKTGSRGRSK
jgi:hypothetical protein